MKSLVGLALGFLLLSACAANAKPGLDIDTIGVVNGEAHAGFTYADPGPGVDPENISHSWDVKHHKSWSGDCDDIAITTLDLLRQKGQPIEDEKALLLEIDDTDTGKTLGYHLIGVVTDSQGREMVVGDTLTDKPIQWAVYQTMIRLKVLEVRPLGTIKIVQER